MKEKTDDYYNKKIDNELKKKKLKDKYGGQFTEPNELPPDVEEEWLNYLEEFEKQFENAKGITVWQYMGKPPFMTIDELLPEDISYELDRLIDLMHEKSIDLCTLCEVDDAVLYEFITEEFFQHEMSGISIPGMTHNFTYEEFHPNNRLDIKHAIDYFLEMTLGKMKDLGGEGYSLLCIDTENYKDADGNRVEKQIITNSINNFLDAFDYFDVETYDELKVELNAEETDAMVGFWIHFKGLFENGSEAYDFKGHGCFKLKPAKYDGWDIYHIDLPGLKNRLNQ